MLGRSVGRAMWSPNVVKTCGACLSSAFTVMLYTSSHLARRSPCARPVAGPPPESHGVNDALVAKPRYGLLRNVGDCRRLLRVHERRLGCDLALLLLPHLARTSFLSPRDVARRA